MAEEKEPLFVAKKLINLTEKPVSVIVENKTPEGDTEEEVVTLQPKENPEEWLKMKSFGELFTMLIVEQNIVELANELHRTTADFVVPLLAGSASQTIEEGVLETVSISELFTLKGREVAVRIAA